MGMKLLFLSILVAIALAADEVQNPDADLLYVFRFGELHLMEQVINGPAANDMIISGRTISRVIEPKGHKMLHKHNLLWTNRRACYSAFMQRAITPTNTISCTPGTEAITGKAAFIRSMKTAFGPAAASAIMPTAFLLPSQYGDFASHILKTGASGIWALKEDVHRGVGVHALPARLALRYALDTEPNQKKGAPARHKYVIAQRFVDGQLLINRRPFVMRLWAVVNGGSPVFRTYLYDGGILPFGSEQIDDSTANNTSEAAEPSLEQEKERAQNLVINLFQQNRSAVIDPWSVADLKSYLKESTGSDTAFNTMWDMIERSTAATVAAAAPSIRTSTSPKRLPLYQGGNVEVLGFDFIVDTNIRPWVIEVNYLPSMARKVIDCVSASSGEASSTEASPQKPICIENPMDLEKEAFLRAHLRTLAARQASVEKHLGEAKAAVQERAQQMDGSSDACNVPAEFLRQLLDAEVEWQAATQNGFKDLTPLLYRSLACMDGDDAACTEALPALPSALKDQPTTLQRKLIATAEWAVAQFHRAIYVADKVIQGIKKRPPKEAPPLKYKALVEDALLRRWMQLPEKDRKGDAAAVLEKLCELQSALDKGEETRTKDEL